MSKCSSEDLIYTVCINSKCRDEGYVKIFHRGDILVNWQGEVAEQLNEILALPELHTSTKTIECDKRCFQDMTLAATVIDVSTDNATERAAGLLDLAKIRDRSLNMDNIQ